MKKSAEHLPLFETTPSGLIYQSGSTSSFSSEDASPYLAIKERALELKALFECHNFDIKNSPSLSKLFADTIELSDAWFCDGLDKLTIYHLLAASQIERIAASTLLASREATIATALSGLLDGNLDLLDRTRSKAKDTLWELELYQILRNHNIEARLAEPDIVAEFSGESVGIACKKFYSESNVSKVLSQAVGQIERTFAYGIVALNLDDLLPGNSILKMPTIDRMSAVLASRNDRFLREHERRARKASAPLSHPGKGTLGAHFMLCSCGR